MISWGWLVRAAAPARMVNPVTRHLMPSRYNRDQQPWHHLFLPTLQRICLWREASPDLHLFKAAVLIGSRATMWVEHPIALPSHKQDLHLLCGTCLQTPWPTALLRGLAPSAPSSPCKWAPKVYHFRVRCLKQPISNSVAPKLRAT